MTVQIDATVAQNGNEVKCNGNFTAPKKGEAASGSSPLGA